MCLSLRRVDGCLLAVLGHPAEQRSVGDAGEVKPRPRRYDRAGAIARSRSDLDLAPAGLAAHMHDHTLLS
jgi:hypothetical protein